MQEGNHTSSTQDLLGRILRRSEFFKGLERFTSLSGHIQRKMKIEISPHLCNSYIVWWIWGGRNTIAKQLDCYCIPMPKKISHMFWLHINPYQSCPSWFFIPTNTTFLRSISEVAIPKDNIREGIFAITLADMFHWFNGEEGKDMSHQ